jgi:3-methyladenine DNA glycosylase AlkC
MTLLPAFIAAVETASTGALEAALAQFGRLKEVKANGQLEYGFIVKTVRPIGLGLGEALVVAPPRLRDAWLKRLAREEKAAARCLACYALGEIGRAAPEAVVAPAHRLAADDRWEVRECIANAFDDQVGLDQPEFVYALMAQWVTDPSPNVRRCATNALMRYGIRQPRKVIALMDQLRHDDNEYVRKNVAFCLQQIAKIRHPVLGPGNPDNPDVMLSTLARWAKDTDPNNRWIVATALGNVWAKAHAPEALSLLGWLAGDADKRVKNAVSSSARDLAKYDHAAVAAAARAWTVDDNEAVRQVGERVLRKIGVGPEALQSG